MAFSFSSILGQFSFPIFHFSLLAFCLRRTERGTGEGDRETGKPENLRSSLSSLSFSLSSIPSLSSSQCSVFTRRRRASCPEEDSRGEEKIAFAFWVLILSKSKNSHLPFSCSFFFNLGSRRILIVEILGFPIVAGRFIDYPSDVSILFSSAITSALGKSQFFGLDVE